MGIEEMINEYKQDKLMSRGFIVDDLGTETRAVYKEIDEVLEDLEQLKSSLPTQQDKVVVPVVKQFIADWYEENKGDLTQGMFDLTRRVLEAGSRNKRTEMQNLLYDGDVDLIELFHRMKDGYTVEKEQLYEVRLPFEQWDAESAELKTEIAVLAYDISSDETKFVNKGSKFLGSGYKTKLNEERIKLIDERYWAFAVTVEEDE